MTREQKDELDRLLPYGAVRFDEPMSAHSSIGAGGKAEAFVAIANIDELKKVIEWARERDIDYRFWGGGSNTLVREGGVKGIVMKLGDGFDSIVLERQSGDDIHVSVGSTTPTSKLVRFAAEQGFAGVEGLAGCYGTVGGNVMTNAGTDAGTIGNVVEELSIVDRECREMTLRKNALKFEYRNLKLPRTAAVMRALLHLKKAEPKDVAAKVDEIMKGRSETQPVGAKSLGCVFRNPGKTPAGILIEEAGLKGVRVGGARVSTVHANFIVNEKNATARDIVVLVNLVRERVRESSSIVLETEIEIIGKD